MYRLLLIHILMLLLSSCSASTHKETESKFSKNIGETINSAPLVEFGVSGGIAGINERTIIYSNGQVTILTRQKNINTNVSEDILSELKTIINSGLYSIAADEARRFDLCADCLYSNLILYKDGEKIDVSSSGRLLEILIDIKRALHK